MIVRRDVIRFSAKTGTIRACSMRAASLNHHETTLLQAARQRGLSVHHGIHTLDEQIELYCRFFRIQ
jgi:hypothetical protein